MTEVNNCMRNTGQGGIQQSMNGGSLRENLTRTYITEHDLEDGDLEPDEDESDTSGDENRERGNWTGKLDFILSCLSYAVGLGNVWRFPYLCYRNGGGVFLIPYATMLIFTGLPLFFMELSFGQYASRGPIEVWKAVPLMKGVGYGMFIVSCFIGVYYNMIIAWAVFYLFASFTSKLPWGSCENPWNSLACSRFRSENCTRHDGIMLSNGSCYTESDIGTELFTQLNFSMYNTSSKPKMPSDEYFHNFVLGISDGLDYMGGLRWQLALCLLFAWALVALCLWKGIKTSGKAVYFTATFPYIVLTVLLVRGLTLPGSYNGVEFYLKPDFSRLASAKVWGDAAVQIFFSLSPCWGGLITLASYNKFHNNCYRDALIVSFGNCLTSFYAGFVIFSILGFMAHTLGVEVEEVADKGAGLAFVAYPEAVSRLPGAQVWSFLFFFMLITLGLGTQFTIMETVITTVTEEFPKLLRKRKWMVVSGVSAVFYIVGLLFCSRAGMYVLQLIDSYAATWSVLIIGFIECFAISWIYGIDNFLANIKQMLRKDVWPYIYWKVLWKFIVPLIIIFIMLFTWIDFSPITYGNYDYPSWADALGWVLSFTSVSAIPIVACLMIYREDGTIIQRIRNLCKPAPDWGPALAKHRAENLFKSLDDYQFTSPHSTRPMIVSDSQLPLAKHHSKASEIQEDGIENPGQMRIMDIKRETSM